jgi:dipeptidase E
LPVRLYLSSYHLGSQPGELVTLAGARRRVGLILNALDHWPQVRPVWVNVQAGKLAALGFNVVELDLRHYFGATDELRAMLGSLDVVWINGGNTFILRRAMKQSGFDGLIRDAVARDEILFAGFSAGACVASPTLRGLELTDDPNEVPAGYEAEIVWDGLGFVPFALAVHYKSDHPQSASVDREVAFYERAGIPYRTLCDGEVLIVEGDRQRIVGSRDSA